MFQISEEDKKLLLQYLSTRPYAEVFRLVAMIVSLKRVVNGENKNKKDKDKIKI